MWSRGARLTVKRTISRATVASRELQLQTGSTPGAEESETFRRTLHFFFGMRIKSTPGAFLICLCVFQFFLLLLLLPCLLLLLLFFLSSHYYLWLCFMKDA